MTTDARLPDWPPPDRFAIGEERARAYIAWIRDHAPPLLAEGRRMLQERWGVEDTGTSSVKVHQLATWRLAPEMKDFNIGCVWAPVKGGTWAMANIRIRRDGRLEVVPGWNMG